MHFNRKRTNLNEISMIKKLYWLLLASCIMLTPSCGSDDDDGGGGKGGGEQTERNDNKNVATRAEYARLEVPRLKGGTNQVIIHSVPGYGVNYMLEWDKTKRSQRWSCCQMTRENIKANVQRYYSKTNQYPQDPDLAVADRFSGDPFYGSGFDHGHIIASADRLYNEDVNYQTFFLTNMQPQYTEFNSGIWQKMENQVRKWVNQGKSSDVYYVCKGGTIDHGDQVLKTTGQGLLVPRYFFMALLCQNSQGYKGIALWAENLDEDHSSDNLKDYMISIDQLEELTGIDFFCNLPDKEEARVEDACTPTAWGFH